MRRYRVERVVRRRVADELGLARNEQRRDVRLDDEQHRDEAQRDHRRLTNDAHAALGLLGQRRNRVEAEEREHGDGQGAEDQSE